MKPKNTIIGILLVYLLVSNVSAVSVGTAPGVYDLGELKPGSNVAFRFYLMTNSANDMLVSLGYAPVHQEMYSRMQTTIYRFIPAEASEEDISSWVEIPRNPLLLSPARSKVVYLSGGGVVNANEEADIILHIPENADPGYHAGSIALNPQVVARGAGTGVLTIAVTRFVFVFRVAGDAKRRGEVTAMIGDRTDEQEAKVDVLFKNTGTCTISARVIELKLFNKFGEQVATLSSGMSIIRPNMIEPMTCGWFGESVKPGTYRAEVKVDYVTGNATAEGTVELPATIKVRRQAPSQQALDLSLCSLLPQLMVVIVILALLVYWLDWNRDLALLILGALLVAAILLFVLTCVLGVGFSAFDALFVLIIIVLIIYWRLS
jgi:hypothetical protein